MFDQLSAQGFAILRDRTRRDILDVGTGIGNPIPEPRDGVLIKELQPRDSDSALRNTLSARYGTGAFPFHTEAAYWLCPPNYWVLFCENPSSGKRPTLLVDGSELALGADSTLFKHVPWLVYRTYRPFYASVLETSSGEIRVRLDEQCMRPTYKTDLAERFKVFSDAAKRSVIDWTGGDLVIIDNWRMLHGRGPAIAADSDRLLLKLLVDQRRVQ